MSCITPKVAHNAGGDASAVEGFATLGPTQQAEVSAAFSGSTSTGTGAADTPEQAHPTVTQQHQFLDKAKDYDFEAVCALVTQNSGYVNCQPAGRWSALHQAAEAGNAETVEFLLNHGADVAVKTSDGKTPLDIAHKDVQAMLTAGRPRKRQKTGTQGAGTGSISAAVLYMEKPVSAAALSEESGSGTSWLVGGGGEENLADGAVTHKDIKDAPPTPGGVARRMSLALASAWLPASESDTQGRVVVITGAGSTGVPPTRGCLLSALGLKHHVDGKNLLNEAQVTPKDYSGPKASKGFCFMDCDTDDEDDDDEDPHKSKVKATTAIMGSELTDHFELNFSDEIVCAPVLYGGRASDGNVVAVLSMRVWT